MNFTLPMYYENMRLNNLMFEYAKEHKEYFNFQNTSFLGAEGSLPFFYWSGVNYNNYKGAPVENLKELGHYQCELNFLLDCGNTLLMPQDFLDVKVNILLKFFENGSNSVIIGHPALVDFFKKHYPQYRLIGSEEYFLFDTNKEYLNDLDFIRINYFDLENEYYANIPKSKISVSISTTCSKCTNYQRCILNDHQNRLLFMEASSFRECKKKSFEILNTKDIKDLIKKGYSNFHLDMKSLIDFHGSYLDLYISIFIKPEFQNKAKLYFLKELNYG